ncbi:MAG: GTP 3',8-cyclase MoaA [Syntrophomonadaceae bacterium]|nr:GTP 3',8-cyclase MoaA [Syntrophomonadaceae bacterium]
MIDKFGREINYLRVSITDRCNLRCRYCMPDEGVDKLEHRNILSLEEMARLVGVAVKAGIKKVRLTGGEPLVRRNIVQLVKYIGNLSEIDDVALTTNGMLYAPMAEDLRQAGLKRLNFSLDTLKPDRLHYMTRGGDLSKVKTAIFKALELGMHPVKINTVVIRGFNDDELLDFARLADEYPLHVRFIEFMPIGDLHYWKRERMIKSSEIKNMIGASYQLESVTRVPGNGPAKYYNIKNGQGSLGFITPMSNHFCSECNRIRLTADGGLRACLHDHHEIDLKTPLRSGASDEELLALFLECVQSKPSRHQMNDGWGADNDRKMYQIGG